MTVNKKIPALRFKEFEGEWEEQKLGDLLTFKNGVNADKNQYGKGIKFINVLDIINNEFITYENIIGMVDISEAEFVKNEVKYGDILFQRSSETREEVGQANVYLSKKSVTFGGFVIRGRGIHDYNPVFMNNLLKTKLSRKEITDKSGGSTRYNVGQETLKEVKVFLCGLPEQQKIASFLTAIDDKIQQLTKKKALLEQYKKGVMQQIFNQQIRFKDDDGNDYPDWEEKKLGDIFTFINTNSLSRSQLNYEKGKVKNIHYGDIHTKFKSNFNILNESVPFINEVIDLKKIPEEGYCKEGDLIIADASEDYNDIGKSIEVVNLDNQKLLAGLHTHLLRDVYDITAKGFKGYSMQSFEVRLQMMKVATGISVLGITKGNLSKVLIHLPVKEEQQKIANILTGIDHKINAVSRQLEQIEVYKKGLLQQMFV